MFLFLGVFLLQVGFWGFVLRRAFENHERSPPSSEVPAVSIIVCFHNEEAHLATCLHSLLGQDHPNFEIIAVDDNSTDASPDIALELARERPQLRYCAAGPTRPGKKDALSRGIRAAKYETILLTDADCRAASPQWARLMTTSLVRGQDIVLGVSLYHSPSTGFLGRWQSFESVYVACQYLGFARLGVPYMGVGRNLAYKKSVFEAAGGFASHAHLPGGDDDLLVGSAATGNNTALVTSPAAWTWSIPQKSWRAYWRQKRRHQSAGLQYHGGIRGLLAILGLSHGLFFLLGLWGLFSGWWPVALAAYVLRLPLVLTVIRSPFRRVPTSGERGTDLGDPDSYRGTGALSIPGAILFDALLAPYYLVLTGLSFLPVRRW